MKSSKSVWRRVTGGLVISGLLLFIPTTFAQDDVPAGNDGAAATATPAGAAVPSEAAPTTGAAPTTIGAAPANADVSSDAAAESTAPVVTGSPTTAEIEQSLKEDAAKQDGAPAAGAEQADGDTAATPLEVGAEGKSPATPNGSDTSENGEAESAAGGGRIAHSLLIAAILVALFVLPILIGNYLARAWNMPEHGWKIALTLGFLAASLVVVTLGEFKFGPDLAGGITLIYEVEAGSGEDVPMNDLIAALKNRVDPTSTREVTIRSYGSAVEVIIPKTGQDALQWVQRRITELGQLEFRITAQPGREEIRSIIAQAEQMPPGAKDVMIGGVKVAEWLPFAEAEFGGPDSPDNRIVKRMAGETPEALVLIDQWNVTGEYLTSASRSVDERGGPAVNFTLNTAGAGRFRQLTSQNLPNEATGTYRHLGIILDKRLISAPRIQSTISDRGQISGGAMSDEEVDYIVGILNAGRLPAKLNKTPISEEVISPTLGAETVTKGESAILGALFAIIIFMLIFYRFSGIIACIALALNLLLVVALMVMISAAFTLPGLAGLVLTIGMSVDANILVYERIREELNAGAALRMAIRNGFSRAMSAIVDANVTTVIAGVALYAFATDQVKGFAVTLILGIITSMFTAIFVSKLLFDIAERRGWLTKIRMMQIFPNPNIDFLKGRWVAISGSLVIILIGLVAVFFRGERLYDIDFTGGSSVTFALRNDSQMTQAEVHTALVDTELGEKNLLVVERGTTHTEFTVDTSEQSVDRVKQIVNEKLGDRLMKFSVEIRDVKPYTEGDYSGTDAVVVVNSGTGYEGNDGISHAALTDRIHDQLGDYPGVQPTLSNDEFREGSIARFHEWNVRLPGIDPAAAENVLGALKTSMESEPLFPLANTIGGRVSGDMTTAAVLAIFVSLVGVIIYLWLRFQNVSYGVAAAAAVVHDVLVTLGFLGLSYYVVQAVPGLASFLLIDSFQVNLTIVAALLTIMGYSLNDTIVTFDRLREVKGKSPKLTAEMVNKSVNQTLGRTILTSLTVFLVVVILYFFGGDGIHGFAFSFLIGVIFGCYSSVYIAAPVLLWLNGSSSSTSSAVGSPSVVLKPTAAAR